MATHSARGQNRSRNRGQTGPQSSPDHDYLIETERNMLDLNSDFIRISAVSESQGRSSRSQRMPASSPNAVGRDIPTRGARDSMFYSEHSGNRRTQAMRTNDPCSQQ